MIEVRPDPKLTAPIRNALRARLSSLPVVPSDGVVAAPPAAAEESLRNLMVSCYPRLKRREPIANDCAFAIAEVAATADWSDLRFIDALNALCEAWHEDHLPELRDLFVRHYRDALTRMLSD